MSQDDLQQLRRWRTLGARQSENVVRLAQRVLQAGGLGDEEWPVREQLTIAALDLGQVKLANLQLRTLQAKFPKSPRADLLLGLKLEAVEEFERARQLYQGLLTNNECNVAAHQRLIALSPSTQDAIGNLLTYLDTFYSDAAAWSLLAELYASLGAYAQSLTALGHLLVLHTWDSQAVTRYAETAYTMGDYQLALKYFLRATEMETPADGNAEGFRTRSWWGVKQTAKRLLDPATRTDTAIPDDSVVPPAKLQKLEALATERILAVGGANMDARRAVLAG